MGMINYDKDVEKLLSNGYVHQTFFYRTPDDENYEDIYIKNGIGVVFGYYGHNGWHSFYLDDASFFNGLPDEFKYFDIDNL